MQFMIPLYLFFSRLAEASFEILPRLCKMKFESGTLEEILFLEFPRECRLSSGIMMLEYGKAIQESIYEQFRVVREGKLRVIFRHDLKVSYFSLCKRLLSWISISNFI